MNLIDTKRTPSLKSLPTHKRFCFTCKGKNMQATQAYLGGWSHKETVFVYKCPDCGKEVEFESHDGFRGGFVIFFFFLLGLFFVFDSSPNYTVYALWSALFIALLLWWNLDRYRYEIIKEPKE